MDEKTLESYRSESDPQMAQYWMRQGPKTAAFLLVIPGCAIIGYGLGLLTGHSVPCSVIGVGTGLLIWGLIVSLSS